MALRRTLSRRRLSSITKTPSLNIIQTHSPLSKLSSSIPPASAKPKFFRLQIRSLVQSATWIGYPAGDKLLEKLNLSDNNRIRLDGLIPPAPVNEPLDGISVHDAKKLLRLAQLEMLKAKLRGIQEASVPYTEFVQICVENSSSHDQGLEFAEMLDESGAVIVIKDSVFLHPEQVAKAIGGLIPLPIAEASEAIQREFKTMEKQKNVIDKKADMLVRRELWGGLGFLVVQTLGLVRLTFWELSWDVMEPVCFYLTSVYFMASYAFFLRTSQEPCFEGFFQSRFRAKQERLMKAHNFDMERFNKLNKACYPPSMDEQASELWTSAAFNSQGAFTYAMHH